MPARPRMFKPFVRSVLLRLFSAALACAACVSDAETVGRTDGADSMIVEAARVRALRPEEARRSIRVLIRGVVTTANADSCVVQDTSGPVFVRPVEGAWSEPPRAGELWEFLGVTDPGEFSPIVAAARGVRLGRQELPRPLRPGWEQLNNGSLDVELVELRSVLLARDEDEITLLVAARRAASRQAVVLSRGGAVPRQFV